VGARQLRGRARDRNRQEHVPTSVVGRQTLHVGYGDVVARRSNVEDRSPLPIAKGQIYDWILNPASNQASISVLVAPTWTACDKPERTYTLGVCTGVSVSACRRADREDRKLRVSSTEATTRARRSRSSFASLRTISTAAAC
jgi:hypothetical protein